MRRVIPTAVTCFLLLTGSLYAQNDDPKRPIIGPENAANLQLLRYFGYGRIHDLDWSPDGKMLAAASTVGVWLYNDPTLKSPPVLLDDANEMLLSVRFSPDGQRLAALTFTDRVCIWDVGNDVPCMSLEVPDRTTAQRITYSSVGQVLAFSPDGSRLAHSAIDTVYVWDLESGTLLDISAENMIGTPVFEAEDTLLLFTPLAVTRLSLETGEVSVVRNEFPEMFAEWDLVSMFSPDSRHLIVGDMMATLHYFDLVSGNAVDFSFSLCCGVYDVDFSRDGTRFAGSGRSEKTEKSVVRVYDTQTLDRVQEVSLPSPVHAVGLDAEGKRLALASNDGWLYVWDILNNEAIGSQLGFGSSFGSFVAGEQRIVALGGWTPGLHVWDIETGEEMVGLADLLVEKPAIRVSALALSSDERFLAVGGREQTMGIIDLESRTWIAFEQEFINPRAGSDNLSVDVLAFSPDGRYLAMGGGEDQIVIWDIQANIMIQRFDSWARLATDLSFTPDGKRLLVQSYLPSEEDDGGLVWDWLTATIVQKVDLPGPSLVTDMMYDTEGSLLAVGYQYEAYVWPSEQDEWSIRVWNVETDETLAEFPATPVINGYTAKFSPDGQLLAVRDSWHMWVYDLATGDKLFDTYDVDDPVIWFPSGVEFSSDGRALIMTSGDRRLQIWGVK